MIFITFSIIVLSILSYKKTVLFSAVVLLYMNNLSSGFEGVKLPYLISLVHILLFYVMGYYKRRNNRYPRLILIPTLIASINYLISSYVGSVHSYTKNIVNIAAWFYYPYIIWHLMSTKKDIEYYGRIFFGFFLIVVGYALLEFLLGQNVYSKWADETGIISGELGGVEEVQRFGLLRCNSILPYCSALGMTCSIVFTALVILKRLGKIYLCDKLLMFMLPFCVLLSGTRSQFVVFVMCFWALFLNKEYRKTKGLRFLFVLGALGALVFSAILAEMVNSILYSNSSSVGGSNLGLRLDQLSITESYWQQAPWFGHGRSFTWEVAIPESPRLLGAESIVFTQLIDHGIFGLMSYYLIGICLAIWCYRYSKPLSMLPIAFIAGKTMSTVVGVEYNILIILCIFVIKAITTGQNSKYEVQHLRN